MRYFLWPLLALLYVTPVTGGQAPLRQPSGASWIKRFVPIGWAATQSVKGDLNGDGMEDLAAVLLRDTETDASPVEQAGARGLLVLFADPAGSYRYQDFAPEALPCASCLDELEGNPQAAAIDLAIAEQRLTVGWSRDTGDREQVKLIIGYDPTRGGLRLLGDETRHTDPRSGKTSLLIRDYQAGTMSMDGQESRVPPRFIPLIEVSAEDY